MIKPIELRYRKTQGFFVPERKDKNGNWEDFNYEKLNERMKAVADSLTNYDRPSKTRSCAFSDTKGIYFREEFLLKAFLAAAREFYTVETNEFEVFDEETSK